MTETDSMRFIFLGDSHISGTTGNFNKIAFIKGIKMIGSLIKSWGHVPVIHLGDVTDNGTYDEYILAKKLIDRELKAEKIPTPFYIPGNHDERNVGNKLFTEFFGERRFLMHEPDRFIILGLDTNIPDENSGYLGPRGQEEIIKLMNFTEELKIVCLHHHLLPIRHTGRERSTILDSGDILTSLFDANVNIVVVGHRHYPNVYAINNGKHRIVMINTGTFSANKTRYRSGHTFASLEVMETSGKVSVRFHGIDDYSMYRDAEKTKTYSMKYPALNFGGEKIATIAQISSTHFTSGNVFQEEVYDKGVSLINSMDVDLVIHCGDVTYEAFPEAYRLARDKFRQIQKPLLVVPGHRDSHPFGLELFQRYIGPHDPIYENPALSILGINSAKVEDAKGHVGRVRMRLIGEQKNLTNKPFVLVMHHSLLPLPRSKFISMVEDAGDVITFSMEKKIPLILSGDEHVSSALQIGKTLCVNAGTFSSRKCKSHKLNTFNVLSIYENGFVEIVEHEIQNEKEKVIGRYIINTE